MASTFANLPADLVHAVVGYEKDANPITAARLIARLNERLHVGEETDSKQTIDILLWLQSFLITRSEAADGELLSLIPFDLFPTVCAYFGPSEEDEEIQQEQRTFAIMCAQALADKTSSPRELILVIIPRFRVIGQQEDCENPYLEAGILLKLLGRVLARIAENRLASTINLLSDELSQWRAPGSDETVLQDRIDCLSQLSALIKTISARNKDEKTRKALRSLLLVGTAVFYVSQGLAVETFRLSHRDWVQGNANLQTLQRPSHYSIVAIAYDELLKCATLLQLDAPTLAETAFAGNEPINNSESQTTHVLPSRIGAFILLNQITFSGHAGPDFGLYSRHQGESLWAGSISLAVVICRGVDLGDYIDELLYWLCWPLSTAQTQSVSRFPHDEDAGNIYTFIELAHTVARASPDPSRRFIAYQILRTLVFSGLKKDGALQLSVFRDAIIESTSSPMQSQYLSLLRDLIAEEGHKVEEQSAFLSPAVLQEIIMPAIQLLEGWLQTSNVHHEDPGDFLEDWQEYVAQLLSLLQVVYRPPASDKLGLERFRQQIDEDFLTPLGVKLKTWTQNGIHSNVHIPLLFLRWIKLCNSMCFSGLVVCESLNLLYSFFFSLTLVAMANAAAKKQAAANSFRLRVLLQGFLTTHFIHLFSIWLRPYTRTTTHFVLYAVSSALSIGIWSWLQKIGTPKHDAAGNIISAGQDLTQSGVTDYMFDFIFITCLCVAIQLRATHLTGVVHILTAIAGSNKFFWMYGLIPAFIGERAWTLYIRPWLRAGRNNYPAPNQPQLQEETSKRQTKLSAQANKRK